MCGEGDVGWGGWVSWVEVWNRRVGGFQLVGYMGKFYPPVYGSDFRKCIHFHALMSGLISILRVALYSFPIFLNSKILPSLKLYALDVVRIK